MASTSQALGEGTGIPAAIGTMLMQRGQVQGQGVLPPEACLRPTEFLPLALQYFAQDAAGKGKASEGLIVERVDENGVPTRINF
jgi:saccharopine dehydrogenase (NAD+, L-lysine-forming)